MYQISSNFTIWVARQISTNLTKSHHISLNHNKSHHISLILTKSHHISPKLNVRVWWLNVGQYYRGGTCVFEKNTLLYLWLLIAISRMARANGTGGTASAWTGPAPMFLYCIRWQFSHYLLTNFDHIIYGISLSPCQLFRVFANCLSQNSSVFLSGETFLFSPTTSLYLLNAP